MDRSATTDRRSASMCNGDPPAASRSMQQPQQDQKGGARSAGVMATMQAASISTQMKSIWFWLQGIGELKLGDTGLTRSSVQVSMIHGDQAKGIHTPSATTLLAMQAARPPDRTG
jgi:hypothetical protein